MKRRERNAGRFSDLVGLFLFCSLFFFFALERQPRARERPFSTTHTLHHHHHHYYYLLLSLSYYLLPFFLYTMYVWCTEQPRGVITGRNVIPKICQRFPKNPPTPNLRTQGITQYDLIRSLFIIFS